LIISDELLVLPEVSRAPIFNFPDDYAPACCADKARLSLVAFAIQLRNWDYGILAMAWEDGKREWRKLDERGNDFKEHDNRSRGEMDGGLAEAP